MDSATIIATLIIITIVIACISSATSENKKESMPSEEITEWPFYANKIMSIPEQQLYWKLVKALPNHLIGFQIQACRALKVKKGHNFQDYFNRINRLSYDFVICNKQSYPIAVIELDDSSHNSEARQKIDQKKNKITQSAGIKIYRWQVNKTPSIDEIRDLFNGLQ